MNNAILGDGLSSCQYFPEDLHSLLFTQSPSLRDQLAKRLSFAKFRNDIALSILLSYLVEFDHIGVFDRPQRILLIFKQKASGIIVDGRKIDHLHCNIFMGMNMLA